MGAAQQIDIHGEKGGSSKPKSPTEANDSLRSTNLAKLLIAVGEGEFDETPTDYDIYLDNTPIRDASGNYNFPNVKWDWRPGSVDQTYIPGIPSVENETSLNVELRSDAPWVRSITNTQLSAVRVRFAWPALQRQDDEGNIVGYRIEYAIDVATDGGAYQQVAVDAVDGKTTTRYERSRRIDLPDATTGWQIRVRRLTANQNSNKIADTMLIAGFTEVIDAKLRYPNTALLYIEFDAEQFTNIPAVTVKCRARKWQVPSNYDPIARTYTGTWDGSMKQAWTNNPAWITFGVCTEDRFGLGKRIKPFMVDKWELYRISQYCDQLVPNGLGGVEPRFLCDMNLQGKADAWSLLRDIAGIYRGMTYWAQGQLVMQADMPRAQDFDYVFTRANVIDGKFSYGSASAKTRYTRALVSYDNPANNYDTDVIPFADPDLQRRLGDKPTELSAIGCTRASEAQRRGKWAILSNNQDRTVSFKTGMEGVIPLPGHIIPVADSLLAGREVGGRISAVAGRVVTLDRDTLAKAGDRLIINLPGGRAEGRTVQSVNSRAVTVTTNYSEAPLPQLQWALDADDLAIPLYRVLRTRRTTEGDFEISALQYDPSKFAYIDTGARLEERPISVIPITVVPAPASVIVTSNSVVSQGIAVATMTITWPAVNGAVAYDIEWRKDSGNWIRLQRTGMTSVDVTGIYAGAYVARVRAVSAFDISSIWRNSMLTQLKGKEGLPPAVSYLTATPLLFGIGLKWGFPEGAEDTQRTEIWYGPTTSLEAATKLADLAYPQSDYLMQSLQAGAQFFFWARLIDRTGNVGPWYPAGIGVMGQASADAGPILEHIAGQISETELGQDLLDRIELIDGPSTLPGSVNSRLKELDDQVSEVTNQLQQQIDVIGDIVDALEYEADKTYAAGDSVRQGQRLYQASQAVPINMPPPNVSYWLDVGQIVSDSNGLAARVTTSENKITSIEGVNTAQGTAITGLQTSLTGKADASALNSLTTRVTSAEGTVSSQGTAITGLNNSLTTTNSNVTTAQNAANAANTLAGGKGKVLVQTAAPVVADQLVQNLWIDITGGANTPKRWTGSAWAAVTDKVATDAAAAAASALAVANTKADASVVSSLTTRVTAAEGTISSQGTSITGLNNSLTTTNSNVTTAQTAANAANTLAGGKGKVLVQTAVPAAADQLAQNLWIDITGGANTPKRWTGSAWAAVTDKVATDAAAAAANALSVANTKADAAAVSALNSRVTSTEGAITSQSDSLTQLSNSLSSLQGDVAGLGLDPAPSALWQFDSGTEGWTAGQATMSVADGQVTISATGADPTFSSPTGLAINGALYSRVRARVTRVAGTGWDGKLFYATPAHSVSSSYYKTLPNPMLANGQSVVLEWDMAALSVGGTDWVNSTITQIRLDIGGGSAADVFAVDWVVVGRVGPGASSAALSSIDSKVTQQGTTLTSQGSSITSLSNSLTTTNTNVTAAQNAANAANTLAGGKGKVLVQTAAPAAADQLAQNLWIDITGGANTPKRWTGSAWAAVTDKVATDAAAAAASALSVANTKADASAVSSLTTRVTSTEGQIAAQATKLDGIYAQVNPALAGDTTGYAGSTASFVGVWSEQSARIEDGIAVGKRVDTVQAVVDENSATVQQVSQAQVALDGKASAMWSVKLQVNSQGQYVAAGIGLGIENGPAGLQSTFLVSADTFAVVNGINGTLSSPFAVTGGQVFIRSAFIEDGSISMLKIGDALQSDNYVAGSTGWRLTKAGVFEINGNVAGAGRMTMTNSALKVFDANGVKRVQLGDLNA